MFQRGQEAQRGLYPKQFSLFTSWFQISFRIGQDFLLSIGLGLSGDMCQKYLNLRVACLSLK